MPEYPEGCDTYSDRVAYAEFLGLRGMEREYFVNPPRPVEDWTDD